MLSTSSFPDALPIGTTLRGGDFVLEGVLGQGGFGITYRVADKGLNRIAAIKEFFPEGSQRSGLNVEPSGQSSDQFITARTRFLEEARTLAKFQHPNIVNVYTIFEENNSAYMVMEFVAGQTLSGLVEKQGPLANAEAIAIIEQVGSALEIVHQAGMLHLDVKPDNIILDESTSGHLRAVLLDFGLTRKLESATGYATTRLDAFSRFGTAGYAPLEQYSQRAQTGAYTDIYALAATLYFLLTGAAPPEAAERASGTALPDARAVNPNVSTPIAGALAIGLAMETQSRPKSVEAFLDLLRAPASSQQTPRPSTPEPPPAPLPQRSTPVPAPRPTRQQSDDDDDGTNQSARQRGRDDDDDAPDDPEEIVEDLMNQLFGTGQNNPHAPIDADPFDPPAAPAPRRRPSPFPQRMPPSQNDPFGGNPIGGSPFGNAPGLRVSGCGCVPGCIISIIVFLFFIFSIIGALLNG